MRKIKILICLLSLCLTLTCSQLNAEWELIDSVFISKILPAGEKCYIAITDSFNYLELALPSDKLTDKAEAAIAIAPKWLQMDLRDNFLKLDENFQTIYADIIINAEYPYIDEICFEVAHIAPQTLCSSMNPQVLTKNVEYLYQIDDYLQYADIIDYQGEDYYSTTKYKIPEHGIIKEIELPREIYYWYIVHPKLHKETPDYIDPESGDPTDPPKGVFWRELFFYQNDFSLLPLHAYLDTCIVLWKNEQNTTDNGAIGAITRWIKDVMTFESHPHHDQPMRIYQLRIGTCSAHSYLTAAAARTSLIPTIVNVMYSDNHKINEFWDRRWIAWEPVGPHIDSPGTYENWGWNVASAFNWRGDSYIWDTTEKYSEVCTLNVNVADKDGNPVDGARIKINSDPCVSWGATMGWTDHAGQKQFLLGDSRTYTAQVTSNIGDFPQTEMDTVITNSLVDFYYNWDVTLPGVLNKLDILQDTLPAGETEEYRIVVEYEVPHEILYGENIDDNNRFSKSNSPGHIDFFICNEENYEKYILDKNFKAFEIHHDSSGDSINFILPTPDAWFVVFSNEDKAVITQDLQGNIKLYRNLSVDIAGSKIRKLFPMLALYPEYPNPFTSEINITFYISDSGDVELDIYDILGQKVKTIIQKKLNAGNYTFIWNCKNDNDQSVNSGIYLFYLKINGKTIVIKKCLLIK